MKRVLIADDDKVLLEQMNKFLKLVDEIEIVGAVSRGNDELDIIKKFSPDIVITDIEMPELTGIEIIEIVSTFEKVPDFIVVTGCVDAQLIKKMSMLPIKRVFTKPVDIEKLKNEILL